MNNFTSVTLNGHIGNLIFTRGITVIPERTLVCNVHELPGYQTSPRTDRPAVVELWRLQHRTLTQRHAQSQRLQN